MTSRTRRGIITLSISILLLLGAIVLSIAVGARAIAPADVWGALLNPDQVTADNLVVITQRIPRTVIGIVAGAALAVAGTLMQGLTRNPLADPGILGVNAGASLAVLVAISVVGITHPEGFVWFAFIGAAVAAVVVALVGTTGNDAGSPAKLALTGAAVTAGLTSITMAILTTDVVALDTYRYWIVGGLTARGLDTVAIIALPVLLGMMLAFVSGPGLNLIALGADTAAGLGLNVSRIRGYGIASTILLCGAATAIAGPLVFIGLVIPHLLRSIMGDDYRWLMIVSVPAGATLLLIADVIGRVIVGEVQAGVVIALLGAPMLIGLVSKRKQVTL